MKKIILSIAVATFALCSGITANAQIIRTLAGTGTLGHSGDGGPAYNAMVGTSWGITMDHSGNIYVADDYINQIRKITPNGTITTIAGTGYPGYTGDGGAATSARLNYPSGLAVDRYNNLYFADNANFAVRKIDTSGIITTVAGDGSGRHGLTGDGGPATSARLMGCVGVAFDAVGNLYITDGNTTVRKVDTAGIIHTIAGSSMWGYSGSEVAATAATLAGPCGIAVDNSGNIYFSDQTDNRIRRISAGGIISDFAGNGSGGFSGDGGTALSARLNTPSGIAVDDSGNVYFADQGNNRIRMVNAAGIISTVAGTGSWNYSGDGGPASAAAMKAPSEVCLGPNGTLFVTDRRNYAVREIIPQTTYTINASTGTTICAGVPDTFTVPSFGNTYGLTTQWTLNGTAVSGTSTAYTNSTLSNGDVVSYAIKDPLYHFVIDSAYSVAMTVNPIVTPTVAIAASTSDTICSGTPVTYTATPTFGGATPSFQWQVNGVNTATGNVYTYTPADGNVVTALLSTSVSCPTTSVIASAPITMNVIPTVTPVVYVAATATTVCNGNAVTFSASPVYGGSTPSFQWKKFGANVGIGNTYSYVPANGDYISCEMTSNNICRSADTATAALSLTVNPSVTPIVNVVSTPANTVDYAGELVTFYSEVTYGGSLTTYQWIVNGVPVTGATASSFSTNVYSTDTVYCQVTSNVECATSPSALSNAVVIRSNSNLAVNEVSAAAGSFNLYPNPNNGIFTLEGTIGNTTGETSIEVYDMMGKLIMTNKVAAQNGKINEHINLDSSLPTGQYVLRVVTNNDTKTIQFNINK